MEEVAKYEGKPALELSLEDIKKYIAPTATDKELFMFMGIAKSYGLNPMKREIHFIKYGSNPGQTVVGYEIYIKRAEKTGKLDGWECTTDGKKAYVTIYRKDWSKPFKWEVDRTEFDKGQSTWKTMPNFMLRKVAIAQAFRLCFPEDLGGLPYMPEEISSETSEKLPSGDPTVQPEIESQKAQIHPPDPPETKPNGEKISDGQRKRLYAIYKSAGRSDNEVRAYLYATYNLEHSADILRKDYDAIIKWAESKDKDFQDENAQ